MYGVDLADQSNNGKIHAGVLAAPFVVCLPLALVGLNASSRLAYNRSAIFEAGQYWRLLTAHLVHTNFAHALLNLAAWLFVFWLAKNHLSIQQWEIGFLLCAVGVDIGLWWCSPNVQWYVGLSGLLHGLLVLSVLMVWRYERAPIFLVLPGMAVKLLWEQTQGALPSSNIIGHPVIVDAHLFGALSGVLCALLYALPWLRIHGNTGK